MGDTLRIDELRRRVQLDPASIAFAALAEEYRREGRFEEAIATCVTGLRRHPFYLSAHVTLGRALAAAGRPAEGRAELERVLELAPENLAAIRGLADIEGGMGSSSAEEHDVSVQRSAQAARCVYRAEVSLALGSSMPHHTRTVAPALLGLEDFLDAISRARGVSAGLGAH